MFARSRVWNKRTGRRRNVPLRPRRAHPPDSFKGMERRLDTLCSLIVRTRDGRKCVMCGSRKQVEAGHIFGRAHHTVRWDFANVHTQCRGHNNAHNRNHDPYVFWFVSQFGYERFAALRGRCFARHKWAFGELQDLLAQYEAIWHLMQKGLDFEQACESVGLQLPEAA